MVKKVTKTQYLLKHVCVNVANNDLVDIRCGGPNILGFDFYVDPDWKPDDIKKFIKNMRN